MVQNGTTAFPGPASRQMIEALRECVIVSPQPFAVDLKRSQGMWLMTVDGQRLFDWAGYYGSKLLGHNHGLSRTHDCISGFNS